MHEKFGRKIWKKI